MAADWPRGCLQIYTGEGKGKTTAAFGLALRAAGNGLRVYIGQFLKQRKTGEVFALERFAMEITLARFGSGNWAKPGDLAEAERARNGLAAASAALRSGQYRLVILDELLGALRLELLTLAEVLPVIDARPARAELVLTGRDAPPELLARADLVSRIEAVKHYYCSGLPAREGIEY